MDATEGNPWGDIKLDEKPHPPATQGLIPEDKVLLAAPGSLHMLFFCWNPPSSLDWVLFIIQLSS